MAYFLQTGDDLTASLTISLGSTYMIESGIDDMISAVADGEYPISELRDMIRQALGRHYGDDVDALVDSYDAALSWLEEDRAEQRDASQDW